MSETASGGDTPQAQAAARQLALQLVRHLGVRGATRTCIQNHWQNVLAIVETMAPPSTPSAAAGDRSGGR